MAVILLGYAAARFVRLPVRTFAIELPGVYLPLQFNINTVVAVLVAGMAATGTDWLLRGHPKLGERATYSHWLLPALSAWIISLPLASLPLSPLWWAAFVAGALLLVFTFVGEYVSVDAEDPRYEPVSLALSGLAYGMFLTLAISLKGVGARLLLILPALALAAFLVSARVQLLRGDGEWRPLRLVAISFISVQIAAALHYWPLSAVGFGLALLGVLYALNTFLSGIYRGETPRGAATEPITALLIFWALAALLR